MNETSDIPDRPYVFRCGTYLDPEYLRRNRATPEELSVMDPAMRVLMPVGGSSVFVFEMYHLKFRPDFPRGEFDGQIYRICRKGKATVFRLPWSRFWFYDGPKSLVFREMSVPAVRARLELEFACAGIPYPAAKTRKDVK